MPTAYLAAMLWHAVHGKVVLKDAANKRIEVPADGVEVMAPQQKSLMPELLLRDFTAEQVADLTTYLSSLK